MRKYIIEFFPERTIGNLTLKVDVNAKLSLRFFIFGFLWTIMSFSVSILPIFGIGVFNLGHWFTIPINTTLIIYYLWITFNIKKNDIGNGVPKVW